MLNNTGLGIDPPAVTTNCFFKSNGILSIQCPQICHKQCLVIFICLFPFIKFSYEAVYILKYLRCDMIQ